MGKKGGKFKRKEQSNGTPVISARPVFNEDMMDDEIDAFHKSRDIVPLDINDDMKESDEDDELAVFDLKDDEDDYVDDEDDDRGLAAKILRTQKYMREKFGELDDEAFEDAGEEDEEKGVWGKKKDMYGADVDYEPQSSDDEDAAEEEAEVLKLQSEKAKALSLEDFGLQDSSQDEDDQEPTLEEIMGLGKTLTKASLKREDSEQFELAYSTAKKDLSSLTKEEQMDVVYRTAPELIGLLSELNDAVNELENKVTPLVEKVKGQNSSLKGNMHYLEVEQVLLLSYCQAIVFYLLMKSEGQPVRDHPVVSRLVEIRGLVDKMKEMVPLDAENLLIQDENAIEVQNSVDEDANTLRTSKISAKQLTDEPEEALKIVSLSSSHNKKSKKNHQEEEIGLKSMEMLKFRASLEEKLKQKGVFNSIAPKNNRVGDPLQPINRRLETVDDFIDEEGKNATNGGLQHTIPRPNKRKVISGDDDIPQRDDIGERRRKHERKVLSGAGIEPDIDMIHADEDDNANEENDSDLEYYHEMEKQHAAKRASKSIDQSRISKVSFEPDTVDGKRHITQQMEKNRGLTRHRKKLTKNPRKKYKLKHKKAEIRRKGQVRVVRKPTGPYGGEKEGINTNISHSRRFKG